MNFNDYEWHDAILKNIVIDRSDPGNNDTITMDIIWPNETSARLIFENTYEAILNLNFGFVGSESIYTAYLKEENDAETVAFYGKWGNFELKDIKCYIFETAISNSKIIIFAKKFNVFDI